MFDYSEKDICAMGRSGIFDTADPSFAGALQERQQKGWIKSVELTAIRKGGESFPVEVDSVILPDEPARSFIILRDVSERKHAAEALKRSEARLHLATEATELAVFEWDLASDRVTGNEWFRRQFGLGPDEPIIGEHIIQHGIDPADQELTNQHLQRAMAPASSGRYAFECRLAQTDARGERWILTHGQVYFKGTGNDRRPVRVLGTNLDITERKIAEEALRESIQELNEYNYALVHNIKAPFRAVKNYASFLVEDLAESLQGQPKQCIDGIQKAVDEANRQFRDLETLYRIRSHTVAYEPLYMREVLDEIASVHQTSPERQLVIAEQWPTIRGERFLLRQLLSELINNGFKYNRSKIKEVEITCHETADKRLEIVIRDNGIGIDSQYHEHIFHIFKRLHTEKEYEGTGIGLAIVRRAVKRLGGELRIESAVGQGTTFVISLPAAVVEDGSLA
jgi:PAS domain S-box-containing protein